MTALTLLALLYKTLIFFYCDDIVIVDPNSYISIIADIVDDTCVADDDWQPTQSVCAIIDHKSVGTYAEEVPRIIFFGCTIT